MPFRLKWARVRQITIERSTNKTTAKNLKALNRSIQVSSPHRSPNSGELHAESHPTSSVHAAAAVSLFGLSDLSGDYAHATDKAHVVHYLNGKTPLDLPSLYVTASPINYGRSAVPTIFAHGTDDHNVPISQSTTMASIL